MPATVAINVNDWPMSGVATVLSSTRPSIRARLKDFRELTKPRMNFLVVATTMTGYYMAARGGVAWGHSLSTLLGTALTAAGASVLNQVAERNFDARMGRTANRPIPAGRVRPIEAWLFGVALSLTGIILLAILVNSVTALLAAITLGTYLLFYTPAKRHTTLCTVIGAVPGALPAMMGFTAVDGAITAPALTLFGILFLWQVPHFLSIAILYRDDYARGGFQMLPVVDKRLDATGRQIVLYSLALVAMTLFPFIIGMAGATYCAAAILLGIAFCGFGILCARSKNRADAKQLFFASIVYLPALLASMAADRF